MNWVKEQHGADAGWRSDNGRYYAGRSPKKWWWLYEQTDAGWSKMTGSFRTLENAKAAAR